jgi:hypothetical protein
MAEEKPPAFNPWGDVWFLVIAVGCLVLLGVVSGTISRKTAGTLFISPPYSPTNSPALQEIIQGSDSATSTPTTIKHI